MKKISKKETNSHLIEVKAYKFNEIPLQGSSKNQPPVEVSVGCETGSGIVGIVKLEVLDEEYNPPGAKQLKKKIQPPFVIPISSKVLETPLVAQKSFCCHQCSYTCYKPAYLRQHLRIHNIGGRKFACEQCNYTTVHRISINRHRLIHSGLKPHVCTYCDYASTTSGNLKIHIMKHTGERPYACQHCDYRSKDSGQLKRHRLSRHRHL